jgi:type III secretory pathway component EscS
LGLPIVVRLIALAIVIGIIYGVIDASISDTSIIEDSVTFQTKILDVVMTSTLLVIYYAYFANKLKTLSNA